MLNPSLLDSETTVNDEILSWKRMIGEFSIQEEEGKEKRTNTVVTRRTDF